MSFLFGEKQQVRSLAEVLEDGRERMNGEMMSLLKFWNEIYSVEMIFIIRTL